MSTEPKPGEQLGAYRIEHLIGHGGMGTVYRGVQLSIDRPVAVKMITGSAESNPEYLARFRREAQAMAKLRHPNTVRLLDFGVSERGRMFMVMELLRGDDLEKRLEKFGPLPLTLALQIVRQTAQSLSEAHALGIVHRDLKPGNIFLSELAGGDCFVKVMDFGVAGVRSDPELSALTMQGAVLGTAAYMAPEQAQGTSVDGRADLYALGVVLFEMLTGRLPFQAKTPVSMLIAHTSEPPPPLHTVTPDQPELDVVQPLLDRLLAKDPDARPASATELTALVDELLAQLGVGRSSGGLDVAASSPALAPRRQGHGHALAAGVLLLLGAAGMIWAWQPSNRFSQPALAELNARLMTVETLAERGREQVARHFDQFRSVRASVTIASVPSGATVQLQGAALGTTPYPLQLRRPTEIEIVLPGHAPERLLVDPSGEPNLVVKLAPLPPLKAAARAKP